MEQLNKDNRANFYFYDPRLDLTVGGRLLVRILSYAGYLLAVATTTIFFLSDVVFLKAGGILLGLFLIDRFVHFGEADKAFSKKTLSYPINLAKFLTPQSFSIIEKAFDRSLITKNDFLLELIIKFLGLSEIKESLKKIGINVEEVRQKAEDFLARSKEEGRAVWDKNEIKRQIEELVFEAFNYALKNGHRFIKPHDVFLALPLLGNPFLVRLFSLFNIKPESLELALILIDAKKRLFFKKPPKAVGGFSFEVHRQLRHRIMNRAWTARPTPTLDRYSVDFTDLARHQEAGFLIGHKEEFERLINTLARPINPNVLLVGEAGVGKETIVAHLAFRLIKDDVPSPLFDKRLVSLDLISLVSGASPEELQNRIQKIVEEIILAGNIILYIPDIHNLVNTSGTAYLSAADALMPVIMNNAFPVIGATYPREFKVLIEPRSDFVSAFEVIRVQEITEAEAKIILVYDSVLLEKQFNVSISLRAVEKAVNLAKRYFTNKFLPSSAEELLKSAILEAKRRGEKNVTPERIISIVESKINVPLHEASDAESQKLLNLEKIIHERLVDQEEAVRAVAEALREYRSGLTRPGGPIASFLFVGPTGVGKTELAKILAKIQFGSVDAMIRFDMTEYQDKQSFFRFIGSPDGKIAGLLTESILQKPYALILLDEFEKAHPDVLNIFLQVLDDGRLTDNLGRLVDFQNTIIIATSNAHSDIINTALNSGQTISEIADYLKRKLTDVFRPELLNRFSKIIVFKDLSLADVRKIVTLNLKDLALIVEEKGIALEFDEKAVEEIAKLSYNPAFGARPMRRVIDEKVKSLLAEKILSKEFSRGTRLKLIFEEGEFRFVEN